MARPPEELHAVLKGLPGVADVYFQPPTKTADSDFFLCERDIPSDVTYADNKAYLLKKGYTVIFVTRDPNSHVPDLVENLPYAQFQRRYKTNGLYHFVFQLYF